MPSKKKGAASGGGSGKKGARVLFGNPNSSNLSMGLVGLPSAGKSLTFNILTKLDTLVANYPFATIDPTKATVPLPDTRFDWLVDLYKPKSEVPATLTVTDIAGLIRGAHKGDGLGNAFLSHIQAVDGIFHVVRGFPGEKITHVMGSVDAVRDLEVIQKELMLKDIATLATWLSSNRRTISRGVGGLSGTKQFLAVEKAYRWLRYGDPTAGPVNEFVLSGGGIGSTIPVTGGVESVEIEEDEELGKELRFGPWKADDVDFLNPFNLLTAKPAVYLVNLSPLQYKTKKAKCLLEVKEWLDKRGGGEKLIPFCASHEDAIMKAESDEERNKLIEEFGKSAIPKIIKEGFRTLNLITFFTSGADEVRAWVLRQGMLAPRAAGAIHSDMQEGFQSADVHHFDDLKEFGSELNVKSAGKFRTEGKAYEVKDGDIMFFRFQAPTKKK